jgi:RluA family pseudouridine synthase
MDILYQDADIIAVDKPEGIATIPERAPQADSLVKQLEALMGHKIFVVHRLDKESSGVVLFAKNAAAHRNLNIQFDKRTVHKTYAALLHGVVGPDAGTINEPLRQFGSGRTAVDRREGKPCTTEYAVTERLSAFTLVSASPRTGRRHQLRAHFYSIGHPIAGDPLYGDRAKLPPVARLMLHAARIEFDLPSGGRKDIAAPLPASFSAALDAARSGKAGAKETSPP